MESTFKENELYIDHCKKMQTDPFHRFFITYGADLSILNVSHLLHICLQTRYSVCVFVCMCVFVSVHAYICLCMCVSSRLCVRIALWFCVRLYGFVCMCMGAPQYETVAKIVRFKARWNSTELWVLSVVTHCCHLWRIMIDVTIECPEKYT